MTTVKQQLAVEKLLENGGNVTAAMRDVGYSEATAHNPANLTESKGYRAILTESGLTESFIVDNLVADIKNKPERRLGELTLASDLLGLRKKGLVVEDKREEKTPEQDAQDMEFANVLSEYTKAKLKKEKSFTMNFPL